MSPAWHNIQRAWFTSPDGDVLRSRWWHLPCSVLELGVPRSSRWSGPVAVLCSPWHPTGRWDPQSPGSPPQALDVPAWPCSWACIWIEATSPLADLRGSSEAPCHGSPRTNPTPFPDKPVLSGARAWCCWRESWRTISSMTSPDPTPLQMFSRRECDQRWYDVG